MGLTAEQLQAQLVGLLAEIDLDRRYYDFCDARRGRKPARLSIADYEQAISETGIQFKHDKRERFFGHQEPIRSCTLYFNVIIGDGALELVIALQTPAGTIGGPVHLLALHVARLEDPGYRHAPPYPRIRSSTADDFREALGFGLRLLEEARARILAQEWGC